MPVTADTPAPYAPASAILSVVERHRNKGLPGIVDIEVLTRAGVSETLAPRTMHALRALDLIGDDGKISEVFEGLRLAPEAEYQPRMADWLRGAYADVLTFVDPETATEEQLEDAFRTYKPIGQRSRMVSLFQGLFTAAGVSPERSRQAARRTPPNGNSKPKVVRSAPPIRSSPAPTPAPTPTPTPAAAPPHEKKLEYRLVDLMTEAMDDPDAIQAILKVITFVKARDAAKKTATDQ